MKVPLVFILFCLSSAALAASTARKDLPQKLSRSHFEFSLGLYTELLHGLESNGSSNLVFSPYSVQSVLSMLFLGTSSASESSRQLRAALHYDDISYVDVHNAFKEINSLLDDPYYDRKVRAANGLFAQKGLDISAPYDRALKEFYRAKVQSIDFRNADPGQTMGVVNDWVSEVTEGDIPALLTAPPASDVKMLLVNALSMDAKWLFPFNPRETFDKGLFFLPNSQRLEVPMMSMRQALPLGYSPELECRILELPFTQRRISVFFLLPDDPIDGLAQLEGNMTSENVKMLLSTLEDESMVNVRIPRFKVDSEVNLVDALQNLGVQDIFDEDKSDLHLMAPNNDLYISTVAHKSVFEVREQGAKGSAATFATVERSSNTNDRYFEVDHPFIFLVWDYYSGMLLLMGRVIQPEALGTE